jgi:hypothetical protein
VRTERVTLQHGFGTVLAASWPILEDRSVVRIDERCRAVEAGDLWCTGKTTTNNNNNKQQK